MNLCICIYPTLQVLDAKLDNIVQLDIAEQCNDFGCDRRRWRRRQITKERSALGGRGVVLSYASGFAVEKIALPKIARSEDCRKDALKREVFIAEVSGSQ